VGDGHRAVCAVGLVQDGEGRPPELIDRIALRGAKCSADVALAQRSASPSREDEVLRPGEARGKLVTKEDHRQFPGYRDSPRRPICLGRPALSLAIDLPCEVDLRIIEIIQTKIRPSDREQFRDTRTREGGDRCSTCSAASSAR
jgi:hypothetical protein